MRTLQILVPSSTSLTKVFTAPFMKKLPIKLTILLIGIILSFVISEALLRLFWNPPYLELKYKRDDFAWMNKFVVLNNFGYRDSDISAVKPPESFRIYSLGDSFTYGWYIDDPDNSYPNVLEDELNERFGEGKVEIINAARPGFNIQDSLDRFRSEGTLFSPDIVTLGINLADLTKEEFPSKSPKLSFLSKLKLYELTFGNAGRAEVASLTRKEIVESLKKDSEQIKNTKKLIEEFGKAVYEEGAILIIVVFPEYDSFNPNKPYQYAEFHSRIKEIVSDINSKEAYNVKIVDLLEAFDSVPDKKELVLNPTDNHPTIYANQIAALEIIKEFDFGSFFTNRKPLLNEVKKRSVRLNENLDGLKGIIKLDGYGNKWVYFDRVFGLGVQRQVLENAHERKIPFMADFIKTAKAYTHEGWPGAQLEINFPGNSEIVVNKSYLGYEIVGVHQLTSFRRKGGSTFSINHDLSDLEIKKDDQKIKINILSVGNFDFHKVYFDIAVSQMDLSKGKVVSFFETQINKVTLKKNDSSFNIPSIGKPGSLPVFVGSEGSYNYIWYGDVLKKARFIKNGGISGELNSPASEDVTIEVPAAKEKEDFGPVVSFI